MKILGTGLTGLIGSRVVEILALKGYEFEDISKETGIDITDRAAVKRTIERSVAPWVFHFAAATDVQGSENERILGTSGAVWRVNVVATEDIAALCLSLGKRMLYLSTDYVFDGKKQSYTEDDTPNPQGWYAVTKYEGEKRVRALLHNGLIVRIANPYRANPQGKKDFVHKMIDRLSAGLTVSAPYDQLFVPTFIDDVARAIQMLIEGGAYGTYHVVGSSAVSPFDAAVEIANVFEFDQTLVLKTTFAQFIRGRAPFPQFAALQNKKAREYGITMSTFSEGLTDVKRQEQTRQ